MSFQPARSFLRKFLVDDVSGFPPFANVGRIINDVADERAVHKACVDQHFKSCVPSLAAQEAAATAAFEAQLVAFQNEYGKNKNPEAFKARARPPPAASASLARPPLTTPTPAPSSAQLAWPGLEAQTKDFLSAVDEYHAKLNVWLPKLVAAMTPEQRARMSEAVVAKRVAMAQAKLQGPLDIDLRAAKKAAKGALSGAAARPPAFHYCGQLTPSALSPPRAPRPHFPPSAAPEKARLAAEELENEGGGGASKKKEKKKAKAMEGDETTTTAAPASAAPEAAKPKKEKGKKGEAAAAPTAELAKNATTVPSSGLASSASTPMMLASSPRKVRPGDGADPSALHL